MPTGFIGSQDKDKGAGPVTPVNNRQIRSHSFDMDLQFLSEPPAAPRALRRNPSEQNALDSPTDTKLPIEKINATSEDVPQSTMSGEALQSRNTHDNRVYFDQGQLFEDVTTDELFKNIIASPESPFEGKFEFETPLDGDFATPPTILRDTENHNGGPTMSVEIPYNDERESRAHSNHHGIDLQAEGVADFVREQTAEGYGLGPVYNMQVHHPTAGFNYGHGAELHAHPRPPYPVGHMHPESSSQPFTNPSYHQDNSSFGNEFLGNYGGSGSSYYGNSSNYGGPHHRNVNSNHNGTNHNHLPVMEPMVASNSMNHHQIFHGGIYPSSILKSQPRESFPISSLHHGLPTQRDDDDSENEDYDENVEGPDFKSILSAKPAHKFRYRSVKDYKTAMRSVPANFIPKPDPSYPDTEEKERAYAVRLLNAFINDAMAEDNEPLLEQWAKTCEREKDHIEVTCWDILDLLIAYHNQPGFLRKRNNYPSNVRKFDRFDDHIDKLCHAFLTQKTICRHFMAPLYSEGAIDDPRGATMRVKNNRKVNGDKKFKSIIGKTVAKTADEQAVAAAIASAEMSMGRASSVSATSGRGRTSSVQPEVQTSHKRKRSSMAHTTPLHSLPGTTVTPSVEDDETIMGPPRHKDFRSEYKNTTEGAESPPRKMTSASSP